MQDTRLFSKVYGCMFGGAIGDALGGPVEHMTPGEIRLKFGGNLERYVLEMPGNLSWVRA